MDASVQRLWNLELETAIMLELMLPSHNRGPLENGGHKRVANRYTPKVGVFVTFLMDCLWIYRPTLEASCSDR